MSVTRLPELQEVSYPDSDGQPMADNTVQFEWISTLKNGFEHLFRNDPDVFVAGDLLWYPEEGNPACRCAPDVLIAFGRPKGDRGSYIQWKEAGIAPQVVMEVLSPGNRLDEMIRKFRFYEEHEVEEYYVYDPDRMEFYGWTRSEGRLKDIPDVTSWTSPRLGVRFEVAQDGLKVFDPDGNPLRSYRTFAKDWEAERQRADAEQQRADAERQRADAEQQRAQQLAARLRELGIDPEVP